MRKAAAAVAPHGAEPPLAGAARLSARRSSVRGTGHLRVGLALARWDKPARVDE